MIIEALTVAAQNFGITLNSHWIETYYQLANRIYILDLLKRHNISAKLINVFFIGDLFSKSRKSPQSEAEWRIAIDKMKNILGIDTIVQEDFGIYDLLLDVDKK